MTLSTRIKTCHSQNPDFTFRQIADVLGCSHYYVKDILSVQAKRRVVSSVPVRCPGCGGLVVFPCKSCELEALLQKC